MIGNAIRAARATPLPGLTAAPTTTGAVHVSVAASEHVLGDACCPPAAASAQRTAPAEPAGRTPTLLPLTMPNSAAGGGQSAEDGCDCCQSSSAAADPPSSAAGGRTARKTDIEVSWGLRSDTPRQQ